MENIKIIIVDDHPLFRVGLRTTLNIPGKIEVVGEASSAAELYKLLEKRAADVILLDILLPDVSGIEIARQLRKMHPNLHLLILSAEGNKKYIEELMEVGINGFVSKNVPEYELRTAIEYVADGGEYYGRDIARIMHCIITSKEEKPTDPFTSRERDIIALCGEGFSAKEIADKLSISLKTVISHKYNIFRKLNIHSANELVRYAILNGIVKV